MADSSVDAIAQIRAQLGPDAVVLSVKQLPAAGIGRLWQRPRIEVVACIPDAPQAQVEDDPLSEIKRQLAELRQQLDQRPATWGNRQPEVVPGTHTFAPAIPPTVVQILEKIGILPLYIQQVLELLRQANPSQAPQTLPQEIEAVCSALKRIWRVRNDSGTNVHVFIGPPGTGKTTCLCKWLAKSVLLENRRARVWRLDGAGTNAAESLSVYCEILGVPVDRFRSEDEHLDPSELLFVDLPGVNWKDAESVETLKRQIGELPAGHVHLVLNAAYEIPVLIAQARAFSSYPIFDVVLTHLDEEGRWGKLWNLVLGTNYSLGWMSSGQNIPGDFYAASAQMLFDRQFHRK